MWRLLVKRECNHKKNISLDQQETRIWIHTSHERIDGLMKRLTFMVMMLRPRDHEEHAKQRNFLMFETKEFHVAMFHQQICIHHI